MRVHVELFRWHEGEEPKVIHRMSHDSHSLDVVAAALQSLVNSAEIPISPDGYRIITEDGTELYGWRAAAAGPVG
jgi:hypothetical protein